MNTIANTTAAEEKLSYWEKYYSKQGTNFFYSPSQFAVFILQELDEKKFIIDIGCGTGRDTLYFAHAGHNALGVDASSQAVAYCEKCNSTLQAKASFINGSIDNGEIANKILAANSDALKKVIYARFFLHAITEKEEENFWLLLNKICSPGDMLALEFRTIRDSRLPKTTEQHYRRFLNPITTLNQIEKHAFSCKYYVEGFGFAKHHNDDAYVARCIAEKFE